MRRKKNETEYEVAVFLTGDDKAATKIVSDFEAKSAIIAAAGPGDEIPDFTAKSVYAIRLAESDFLSASVVAAGGARLKITRSETDVFLGLSELAQGYDPRKIAVKLDRDDDGITLTYAYYAEDIAEKFLMDVSRLCAPAQTDVIVAAAYEPVAADEDALNAVAGLFDVNRSIPEPQLVFRGYLGAGEKVKLVMQKDVSGGVAGAEAVIEALLSKERIRWRRKKA